MNRQFKLYIFDVDGTLADNNSTEMYEHADKWFENNPDKVWAIASNQGGVGMRYWLERDKFGDPEKYPTEQMIWDCFNGLFVAHRPNLILTCYRYQSAKGNWSPVPPECAKLDEWRQDWRKPAGGMLMRAMQVLDAEPFQTIMIGDREEDFIAAAKAGCEFSFANDFFDQHPF